MQNNVEKQRRCGKKRAAMKDLEERIAHMERLLERVVGILECQKFCIEQHVSMKSNKKQKPNTSNLLDLPLSKNTEPNNITKLNVESL